jgi:Cu-Zn family superoxide dismutase
MISSSRAVLVTCAFALGAAQVACSNNSEEQPPTPTATPSGTAPATGAPTETTPAPTTPTTPSTTPATPTAESPTPPTAVGEVALVPLGGSKVAGKLRVEQRSDGVWLTGDVSGLTPGKHGFHIHEKGDCSAPDGSSVGPHFAPTSKTHGDPTAPEHHAGDMGNIQADADGTATVAYLAKDVMLKGTNAVEGRAIVIHGGEDDLKTQPSGNSGSPVACGVIALR